MSDLSSMYLPKVVLIPEKELALHSVWIFWYENRKWNCENASIRYSICLRLVSRLCLEHAWTALFRTYSVSHHPNQLWDEAKNETKVIHTTELELIKYTVSCFLWEIASVLRCVKNKTFRDNIFKPYYCKIPVIKLTVSLIGLKITCIESRTS